MSVTFCKLHFYFINMLGELSETEIAEVLQNNIMGRLGCSDGERPYVVPVSFIFRNDHILCHSYMGMKIAIMRANPSVCFEVDEIKDYSNWKCVIAWGYYEELTAEKEIAEARNLFSDEMLNTKVSETALPPDSQPDRWHNQPPGHKESIYY